MLLSNTRACQELPNPLTGELQKEFVNLLANVTRARPDVTRLQCQDMRQAVRSPEPLASDPR